MDTYYIFRVGLVHRCRKERSRLPTHAPRKSFSALSEEAFKDLIATAFGMVETSARMADRVPIRSGGMLRTHGKAAPRPDFGPSDQYDRTASTIVLLRRMMSSR